MHSMNKRALSGVMGTILIMVLGIVSAIIFGYSIKYLLSIKMSPQTSCLDTITNEPIKLKEACYNKVKKELIINLERDAQSHNINDLQFLIETENKPSSPISATCSSLCDECTILNPGETKEYILSLTPGDLPKKLFFKINNCFIDSYNIHFC